MWRSLLVLLSCCFGVASQHSAPAAKLRPIAGAVLASAPAASGLTVGEATLRPIAGAVLAHAPAESGLTVGEIQQHVHGAGKAVRSGLNNASAELTTFADILVGLPGQLIESGSGFFVLTDTVAKLIELFDAQHVLADLMASPELQDRLAQLLYSAGNPDWRMDGYCRVMSFLLYLLMNAGGEEEVWVPEPEWVVPRPTENVTLDKQPAGLAGMMVQSSHLDVMQTKGFDIIGEMMHSWALPQLAGAAGQGDWYPGENPISVIRDAIGEFAWPKHRNMLSWGLEPIGVGGMGWPVGEQQPDVWSAWRYSDAALEALVFEGIGQHRVVRVDRALPGPAGAGAPADAYYVLSLGFAASLEVRDGFERLGADAYFDRDGKVLAIVRGGATYTPGSPLGTGRSCATSAELLGQNYFCTGWQDGWLHAKLALRGTLLFVVTALDHLLVLHLTYGNALSIASFEQLPPTHTLRGLTEALTYRTDNVNYIAKGMLLAEKSYLPRATALTNQGFRDAFAYGNATLVWSTVPERRAARGVDSLLLPFDEDGDEFYQIVHRFVGRFVAAEIETPSGGGTDACARDGAVRAWYSELSAKLPSPGLPEPMTCAALVDVLATFAYDVSAGHRHAGTVAGEVEDPCFAPWAWRKGELCGTPRQTLATASLMSLTSLEQPRIVGDYTYLFDRDETKLLWRDFTAELREFGTQLDARNDAREAAGKRRYRVFEPKNIETSVAI